MKIIHITNTDPAGSVYNFMRATNEHTSHRARLITTNAIPQFEFPRDIMDIFDSGDEAEALLRDADVIHLHKVDDTFTVELPLEQGPRILKISDYTKGKKVVHHIHGTPRERGYVKETAENFSKEGRLMLCSTPDLAEVYQHYYSRAQYFPNCVPINDVRYLPRATDDAITGEDRITKRFCVFQSGTNSILKNMHVIEEVMEKLGKELPVFFLKTSPSNIQTQDMTLRHKRIAHIVFDHIEGYYGLSSLEGLSMGKPTIAGLSEYTIRAICSFFGIESNKLPWVVCRDAKEIEKRIREIILDEIQRLTIGNESRKFMEDIWSDDAIARRLVEIYESI